MNYPRKEIVYKMINEFIELLRPTLLNANDSEILKMIEQHG